MRVWLGILVLAVVVTGSISVYLVGHPPQAEALPEEEAPPGGSDEAGDVPVPAPLAPSGLEPGMVPDDAAGSVRARPAPPSFGSTGPSAPAPAGGPEAATPAPANATGGTTGGSTGGTTGGTTGGSTGGSTGGTTGGSTGGTTGGTDGATGGTSGGAEGGTGDGQSGGAEEPAPPPAPTPRSWAWVHDFRVTASPDAFEVPAGLKELEFKVVFAPRAGGLATTAPVSANLVGPDSVVKLPCASPAVLVGQHVCGPFRTPALAGRWEVQYTGTAAVDASISLRELP